MLTVIKSLQDYSKELENYLSESVIFNFTTDEYLYISFRKKFSDIYIELRPIEKIQNTLQAEYYNGTWNSFNVLDCTNGFNKSGFIRWDKSTMSDWDKTTVSGNSSFWVRFKLTNAVTNLEVFGINLVFADDNDLRESYPDILQFLPEGQDSFISYHQEARNYIISYLRNKGKTITQQNKYKLLDQFDLHNFDEVRQAAKYLALSNIFYNESDAVDDKWKQKGDGFFAKYSNAINLNFLSIDENDNGNEDPSESNSVQYVTVKRL